MFEKIMNDKIGRIVLIVFGCIMGLWGGVQLYNDFGTGKEEERKESRSEQVNGGVTESVEAFDLYTNQSLNVMIKFAREKGIG